VDIIFAQLCVSFNYFVHNHFVIKNSASMRRFAIFTRSKRYRALNFIVYTKLLYRGAISKKKWPEQTPVAMNVDFMSHQLMQPLFVMPHLTIIAVVSF